MPFSSVARARMLEPSSKHGQDDVYNLLSTYYVPNTELHPHTYSRFLSSLLLREGCLQLETEAQREMTRTGNRNLLQTLRGPWDKVGKRKRFPGESDYHLWILPQLDF